MTFPPRGPKDLRSPNDRVRNFGGRPNPEHPQLSTLERGDGIGHSWGARIRTRGGRLGAEAEAHVKAVAWNKFDVTDLKFANEIWERVCLCSESDGRWKQRGLQTLLPL